MDLVKEIMMRYLEWVDIRSPGCWLSETTVECRIWFGTESMGVLQVHKWL